MDKVLDLKSDSWNVSAGPGPSTSASVSASSPLQKQQKRQVLVDRKGKGHTMDKVLHLTLDKWNTLARPGLSMSVSASASIVKVLSNDDMDVDKMVLCYHKLAMQPVVPEDVLRVEAKPVEEMMMQEKRCQGTGGGQGGKVKGKPAPVPMPPVPQVVETL
ncbi:hypothetical protein FRC10_002265, partial [Ceratobasidium sp. 414]